MDYTTISLADRLLLARDVLRGKESDHFRASISNDIGAASRMEVLSSQIEDLRVVVSALEEEASKTDE